MQQGDEGRRRGTRAADQVARPAQQVQVGGVAAVDCQRVEAVGRRAGVQHVDDVVARRGGLAAGRVDGVHVRAGLPVEVQGVPPGGDAVVRGDERAGRGHRPELVDGEGVGAVAGRGRAPGRRRRVAAVGERLAAQEGLVERERVVVGVAEEGGAVGRPAARSDGATQVHHGPRARVSVLVIAVHTDAGPGPDDAAVRGIDVVADAERDRPAGRDPRTREYVEILAGRARVRNCQAYVAGDSGRQQDAQTFPSLGEVDISGRRRIQHAAIGEGRVDLEVVGGGADATPRGDQREVVARDVRAGGTVSIKDGSVGGQPHVAGPG